RVKESIQIPVVGNGDIRTPEDAKRMMEQTGCDAVLIGRAAQGNPWIFKRIVHYLQTGEVLPEPTLEERIPIILRHAEMLSAHKGDFIGIREMRSHLTAYVKGLHGATEFRRHLTKVETLDDIKYLLDELSEELKNR
ncbi:MAG: tRNA-dihydrouridine synthase, partial [Niameybacter sp.]